MNRLYKISFALFLGGISLQANAQRYLNEVFTNSQITIQTDVQYGQNISIEPTVIASFLGQQALPDTLPL